MNIHDSRRIEQVLRERGYNGSESAEKADLIIFNTCSIRAKAEQKLFSAVGTFRDLKRERPEIVVVVAGCMAQQYGKALFRRQPVIDIAIGPDHICELPDLVDRVHAGGGPLVSIEKETGAPRFLQPRATSKSPLVSGYVTIMKGCDERCSFCIVPYTRGPEMYRPADEIVDEVAKLVEAGVREITLLGQTVNSWRDPAFGSKATGDPAFAKLLRRVAAEVPELQRLRYTSPHPRYMTGELVQAHAELAVLPLHVHLPVQSGSDRVLKRMVRHHGRDQYIESARALKRARPGIVLSTDLIVGFPGETDEDFEQTLDLVREVGFVSGYAFKYSSRPFTPALKLGDTIPETVKEERLASLLSLIELQQTAHLESLVGQRVKVLLEGPNRKEPSHFTGRSQRHEIVHVSVPKGSDWTGKLVDVLVQHANKHSLMGSFADGPRPQGFIPGSSAICFE
jgi:tRNA-2-methylthio-N6-dimethylallyladenosine synthase